MRATLPAGLNFRKWRMNSVEFRHLIPEHLLKTWTSLPGEYVGIGLVTCCGLPQLSQ